MQYTVQLIINSRILLQNLHKAQHSERKLPFYVNHSVKVFFVLAAFFKMTTYSCFITLYSLLPHKIYL